MTVDNFYDYANELLRGFLEVEKEVDKVVDYLLNCKGIVYTCGNGGSAASASHFTQDLIKKDSIKSICMSDNIYHALAIANDYDFSEIYSRYITRMYKSDDLLFLISGSGNSENLVLAAKAMSSRIKTICLVGYDGGRLKEICDHTLHVPVENMGLVESVHSAILHYMVEKLSYAPKSKPFLFV